MKGLIVPVVDSKIKVSGHIMIVVGYENFAGKMVLLAENEKNTNSYKFTATLGCSSKWTDRKGFFVTIKGVSK